MRMASRRGGFTIVELLVVIGIMSLILGLLLPAMAGVRKRARKGTELGHLRQVGVAWLQYTVDNNDSVLPGYLDVDTLEKWRSVYRHHDGTLVKPGNDYVGTDIDNNYAGPWTWRLMSYLDYSHDVVLGHKRYEDTDNIRTAERAEEIAFRPAFSYNALFMGGWYIKGGARSADVNDPDGEATEVVSRSLGSIRRTDGVVTHLTAALRLPGVHRYKAAKDDFDSLHYAVPPRVHGYEIWGKIRDRPYGGGGTELEGRIGGDLYSIELYGNAGWRPPAG